MLRFALAASMLFAAGCDSSQSRARAAYADYQAASAEGDMAAAKRALLELVKADDATAQYWIELGKVQLALGDFGGAYYALTRAHELDRANVDTLSILTQLALLGGNTEAAEGHARQLELVAPSHPAVALTYGHVALRRSDLDEADRRADQLLAISPYDTSAKVLKARIMLARGDEAGTETLLLDQVKAQPSDVTSIKALANLYDRQRRWGEAASTSARLFDAQPEDKEAALMLVRHAFLAGDSDRALDVSEKLIRPDAAPGLIDDVLQIWSDHWRTDDATAHARRLASKAGAAHVLAFATYFNRVGSPNDTLALLGAVPDPEITTANSSRNALRADALALSGKTKLAADILDKVLAIEPDHVAALRARIDMAIASGSTKTAVRDAQRLTSILPNSAVDRLRLARVHEIAGDLRQRDRTLWNAFNDIPNNDALYQALLTKVARRQGPGSVAQLEKEYAAQRNTAFMREFV